MQIEFIENLGRNYRYKLGSKENNLGMAE